jgi:hypothetical protein
MVPNFRIWRYDYFTDEPFAILFGLVETVPCREPFIGIFLAGLIGISYELRTLDIPRAFSDAIRPPKWASGFVGGQVEALFGFQPSRIERPMSSIQEHQCRSTRVDSGQTHYPAKG